MADTLQAFMPLLVRSAVEQEVERQAASLKLIKKGDKGDKGEKGDRGKDGYTPQKGVDYFDGLPGKDGYTPIKGVDYFDGLPGRDADLSPTVLAESLKLVLQTSPELLSSLKGEPGKDGVAFELAEDVLTFGGEWKAGSAYRKGALVALGGDIWYRDRPGSDGKPGNSTAWKMFLRSGAGRLSGYGVVQAQPGGIGQAVAGGTAGSVLYIGAGGVLAQSANLAYSESSGPRLTVGSGSGTSQGWTLGYAGSSGFSGLWITSVTPSTTNCTLLAGNIDVIINAQSSTGTIGLRLNNTVKALFGGASGAGLSISAATATTDVQALSATQMWNNASVTFTGWKFTITDTASASGSLALQILGGASGTTNLFSVNKDGRGDFGEQLYVRGTQFQIGPAGAGRAYYNTSTGWALGSGSPYGFSSSTDASAAASDTSLSRISAGVVGVGTGAAGSFAGSLKLTSNIVAGVTFANLNASPTAGEIQTVTDSNTATWGATIAGGGSNTVLAFYNGTNWTVAGA